MVMQWMLAAPLQSLMSQAATIRDERKSEFVTFSPKVFLPVTKLCRDTCGYCTFAQPPRPGQRCFMLPSEVIQTALDAQAAGCTEALITVGGFCLQQNASCMHAILTVLALQMDSKLKVCR